MGGRKSRRERRAQRDKKFTRRFQSPPSYASKEENLRELIASENDGDTTKRPEVEPESRSPSPINSGEITYITSFGGEDENPGPSGCGTNTTSKNQTMTKLQQLKAQLTLGSIIGEKREAVASAGANRQIDVSVAKSNTSGRRTESSAKPFSYRKTGSDGRGPSKSKNRNRSPPRRYTRSRSRSRERRNLRDQSSRSRSSSSDISRYRSRRRKESGHRRRRSSPTSDSSSSSSSSYSTYSRRRRSRSKRRSPEPSSSRQNKTIVEGTAKNLVTKSSAVPGKTTELDQSSVVPPAPAPPPSIETEELHVPIKKYYGRRKEDLSDSELSYSEEEEAGQRAKVPEPDGTKAHRSESSS